jgi:hypothetical protein
MRQVCLNRHNPHIDVLFVSRYFLIAVEERPLRNVRDDLRQPGAGGES